MELIVDVILFLIAGYWVEQGLSVYTFWAKELPGSGFIPTLFGLLVMVLVCVSCVQHKPWRKQQVSGKTKEEQVEDKTGMLFPKCPKQVKPLIPVAYTIIGLVLILKLGVIPGVILIAFVWLYFLCGIPLKTTLPITIGASLFVYLIFVLWLRVPFPKGIFGI